ncbi:His-Xaa-Ser system protein HxsD [Providencia zhijiangensis]|uniref:His-Xaa-Ser system protein HxsD n=1 Tax=Providencia zhijiangensis TaxID=3053982 RepID=A0ABZ0N606_9GAMM|nr:His-Xaa-Ser system protein HxsD [Providencia sp. D4759]WPA93390.1 His-Xaa-Ser system protein HxsD [Providencia sp. D4759]
MKLVTLNKQDYSLPVVRQALYWMNEFSEWTIDDRGNELAITFVDNNEAILFKFYQLLNDYSLREKIDIKTRHVRNSIINKVLASLDERLSK